MTNDEFLYIFFCSLIMVGHVMLFLEVRRVFFGRQDFVLKKRWLSTIVIVILLLNSWYFLYVIPWSVHAK